MPSRKVRLAKVVTIPPMTQAAVQVATPVGGLCFMQNDPKSARKNVCLMTQGVMDIVLDQPLKALGSNFGHQPVHLPKHTVFDLALPSPIHILTLDPLFSREAEAKKGEAQELQRTK